MRQEVRLRLRRSGALDFKALRGRQEGRLRYAVVRCLDDEKFFLLKANPELRVLVRKIQKDLNLRVLVHPGRTIQKGGLQVLVDALLFKEIQMVRHVDVLGVLMRLEIQKKKLKN